MTVQETSKLIFAVSELYPVQYKGFTPEQFIDQAKAWAVVLDDVSYGEAVTGLKLYAKRGEAFPPAPGQLIEIVKEMRRKMELAKTLTELGLSESIEFNVGKEMADLWRSRALIEGNL